MAVRGLHSHVSSSSPLSHRIKDLSNSTWIREEKKEGVNGVGGRI